MKPMPKSPSGGTSGFTILEVVIALIVASILGGILLQFMGHTVQKSYQPINMARESMELSKIVEKMNADYKKRLMFSADPLNDFKTDVENGNTTSPLPYYGDYTVTTTWVVFNPSGTPDLYDEAVDGSGDHRVLKVTVVRGQHEITSLYTK